MFSKTAGSFWKSPSRNHQNSVVNANASGSADRARLYNQGYRSSIRGGQFHRHANDTGDPSVLLTHKMKNGQIGKYPPEPAEVSSKSRFQQRKQGGESAHTTKAFAAVQHDQSKPGNQLNRRATSIIKMAPIHSHSGESLSRRPNGAPTASSPRATTAISRNVHRSTWGRRATDCAAVVLLAGRMLSRVPSIFTRQIDRTVHNPSNCQYFFCGTYTMKKRFFQ